ncbi:sulfotransferase [Lichenicoccus sp.]|uniref:sulfotransferase family protein n=1 Tax=Lichenicoccus sp. TaxID=2781899 RepID=UPI003D15317A
MDEIAARQRAIALFEAGAFAEASRALAALLARIPAESVLLRLCGMAMLRSGELGRGLPYLARARRLAPQDPVAALWHGIALHSAQRFAEAASALETCAGLAPRDPAPLIHLSRALLKLSRPLDAVQAAGRALSLAPELLEATHALCLAELAVLNAQAEPNPAPLAQAWAALGRTCLRLDNVLDARGALQQALALQPDDPVAACDLAVVEHLCGEPLTALARLRTTVAGAPRCEPARLALADRLLAHGEPAEALAVLDEARNPESAQWCVRRGAALAGLGRIDAARDAMAQVPRPAADTELLLCRQEFDLARATGDRAEAAVLAERIARSASDRAAATLEQRIDAHFALGAFHDEGGQRARAFAHWREGHASLRRAQLFSRARHSAVIDATIGTFDGGRMAHGPAGTNRDAAPVFIVGLPRTGTTLAEHILAAHRSVHGAGERLAIRETLARLTGADRIETATQRAARLGTAALDRAASDYLTELHALAPEATTIIDKMPDNVLHLGFIATLLPGARVICCTRDLRDVGASIFQHGFIGHHPYAHDLADLGWYIGQHQRLLRHWRAVLPLPMLELDHAEWLVDFDATLRRVLDFLGLPYDPACVRFDEQEREAANTASRAQVRQTLNARGVGRWRAYEAELAPMLRELDL